MTRRKPSLFILACFASGTAFANDNPSCQSSKAVYTCSLSKFSHFELRKLGNQIEDGYSMNVLEATRDRSGPGVYTKDVHTLIDTSNALSSEMVDIAPYTKEYRWKFEGQGGRSTISLTVVDGAPEPNIVFIALGKGNGPVAADLKNEWKTYVQAANKNGSDAPKGFIKCFKEVQ